MKKILTVLLCISMMLVLVACSNDPADGGDDYVATPSDILDQDPTPLDPSATADNEQFLEDMQEAHSVIDVYLDLPASFEPTRAIIVDETIVQVEFKVDGQSYVARMSKGLQENLSLLSGDFGNEESVTIDGLAVALRYTLPEEREQISIKQGVAEVYHSERDLTISVVVNDFQDKESFQTVVEQFLASLSDTAPVQTPDDQGDEQ